MAAGGARRRASTSSSGGSSAKPPDAVAPAPAPPPPADPAAARSFWENARLMVEAEECTAAARSRVVGAWDWHAWQVVVACLPAAAVYAGVCGVRAEKADAEERAGREREGATTAATATTPDPPASATPDAISKLESRLAAVEARMGGKVEPPRPPPPAAAGAAGDEGWWAWVRGGLGRRRES